MKECSLNNWHSFLVLILGREFQNIGLSRAMVLMTFRHSSFIGRPCTVHCRLSIPYLLPISGNNNSPFSSCNNKTNKQTKKSQMSPKGQNHPHLRSTMLEHRFRHWGRTTDPVKNLSKVMDSLTRNGPICTHDRNAHVPFRAQRPSAVRRLSTSHLEEWWITWLSAKVLWMFTSCNWPLHTIRWL